MAHRHPLLRTIPIEATTPTGNNAVIGSGMGSVAQNIAIINTTKAHLDSWCRSTCDQMEAEEEGSPLKPLSANASSKM